MRVLFAMGLVAALTVVASAQAPQGGPQGGPQAAPRVPTVVKVGDMAPEFSMQGTDGKTHKLSDYRGKQAVVVAWFPKAFTQGCTIECKSLADNGEKIRKYDVAYFMASVDPIEDNIAFAKATSVTLGTGDTARVVEKQAADFPMLSDPSKEVAAKYGVLNTRGVSDRWTFYIDKSGKVAAIETAVRPATSAEDMLAKLEEIKVAKR